MKRVEPSGLLDGTVQKILVHSCITKYTHSLTLLEYECSIFFFTQKPTVPSNLFGTGTSFCCQCTLTIQYNRPGVQRKTYFFAEGKSLFFLPCALILRHVWVAHYNNIKMLLQVKCKMCLNVLVSPFMK